MHSYRVSNALQRVDHSGQSSGLQRSLEETVRALLRWKKYLALSLVTAVVIGLAAAYFLQNRRYEFHGALLYSPNEITAPYYRPPLLGNLIHAIDTPVMLEEINKRCRLGSDLSELRRNVSVELVPSGDTLIIRVIRPDREEAERVLRTVMTSFADESRNISKEAIAPFVKEFHSNLVSTQEDFQKANASLQSFLDDHKFKTPDSLESALTSLQRTVAELDFEREMATIELDSATSKRDRLKSLTTADEKDNSAREVAKLGKPLVGAATDSDRRQFLRDQIANEQESSSYAVKLSVKERERARVKKLHDQGLISESEMDRVEGELEILRAEQNARVERLQGQLLEVEQRLARRLGGHDAEDVDDLVVLAGFAESPNLFEQPLASLELEVIGAENKVAGLTKKLASRTQELEQLTELQKGAAPLILSLSRASDEAQRIQSLAEQFDQAYRSEVGELRIVQPPTPTIDGVRSNGSKLFGAAFIGTIGLLIAPIFLLEWRRTNLRTPANVARHFGVPLLADLSGGKVPGDGIASAALNIQRQLPRETATLLAVGCSGRSRLLAEALAKCGDSVVVVDLDGDNANRLGLPAASKPLTLESTINSADASEHKAGDAKLSKVGDQQDEPSFSSPVIRSASTPNLWYLGLGSELAPDQLLDQNKVAKILAELKKSYSIVLITGIRLGQHLRLDCLVDHVDRIVICSSEAVLDRQSVEAADELIMMDEKVLGIIA